MESGSPSPVGHLMPNTMPYIHNQMKKKKTMQFDSTRFASSAQKLKENKSFDEKMEQAKLMKQAVTNLNQEIDFHKDFKFKEEGRLEWPQTATAKNQRKDLTSILKNLVVGNWVSGNSD